MTPDPSRLLHRRVRPFGQARVYEVGGHVRDRLAGIESKDIDYVVTGLPGDAFPTVFMHDRMERVGASFGVYKIQLCEFGEPLTPVLDVALPRVERSTGPGHRDFEVKASHTLSIEEDLSRRDYTINAMAYDVEAGTLIDPFGGQAHLQQQELVFVGDAHERVAEDPLRLLRAFRLMVKLNLRVPLGQTRTAIREGMPLLATVSPERVFAELWTMLSYPHAHPRALARALYWMMQDGALTHIIPEYGPAQHYDQGTPYHHLTLADHMIESVAHAQSIGAGPLTKLALLLHDLGKPQTRVQGEGRCTYHGHEEVGARIAVDILRRLRAPGEVIQSVHTLITHHMRLSPRFPIGDKGLRRFVHELGPLWRDSLDHRYADLMSHSLEARGEDPGPWREVLLARGEALGTALPTFSDHTLALTGSEIMRALGITGGPEVGRFKQLLVGDVVDGTVPNEKEALTARLRERVAAGEGGQA